MTMHVSAWFRRDARPQASGASPIPLNDRTDARSVRETCDHARQCQTTSPNGAPVNSHGLPGLGSSVIVSPFVFSHFRAFRDDPAPHTPPSGVRETSDHARECMVQTGRKSSNLGRQPDPS